MGLLPNAVGWLVGIGPGAGLGLLLVITGLGTVAIGLGGYLFPAVRDAEKILADHDGVTASIESAV